jgi:hypothetical protein
MPLKTREQVQDEVELSTQLEESTAIEEKVDEYGRTQAEIDELNLKAEKRIAKIYEEIGQKQTRLQELETDIIVPSVRDVGPTKGTEVVGTAYTATIGKEKKKRTVIDPVKAFMLMTEAKLDNLESPEVTVDVEKLKVFLEIVGIPLGQLDDYLGKHERESVISETTGGIGSRRFKVEPRK